MKIILAISAVDDAQVSKIIEIDDAGLIPLQGDLVVTDSDGVVRRVVRRSFYYSMPTITVAVATELYSKRDN